MIHVETSPSYILHVSYLYHEVHIIIFGKQKSTVNLNQLFYDEFTTVKFQHVASFAISNYTFCYMRRWQSFTFHSLQQKNDGVTKFYLDTYISTKWVNNFLFIRNKGHCCVLYSYTMYIYLHVQNLMKVKMKSYFRFETCRRVNYVNKYVSCYCYKLCYYHFERSHDRNSINIMFGVVWDGKILRLRLMDRKMNS